ncbi:MAG: FAD-dependent monooxygenase [Rhizobiales bacterium]|nr:FAD-dependent monooxygenase [Hyphomicrobiales bacterium]
MQPLSIAIAGCGPAGLAAALALSRQGHAIQLFDQFDIPRPLGSGLILQPPGLAVLDWLGPGPRLRGLGQTLDRLYGRAIGSGRVVLDVKYKALGPGLRGLGVHRAALFNVLHDAVLAADLPTANSRRITALRRASERRPLLLAHDGAEFGPFDLVIDALGSRSPLIEHAAAPVLRRRLGYGAIWASLPWCGNFDEHALEQRYRDASVMIGVLPIGRLAEGEGKQAAFFWSLKTDDHPAWLREGLEGWKDRVCALWPETAVLLDHISDPAQLSLASYGHHTLPLPFGERVVFIGDSAHSTSPQLGQGANMALLDVAALAQALEDHDDLATALSGYARLRRLHVRLYQALSVGFTPFYQSDSRILPLIRDQLVSPLSRMPGATRLLAGIVAGLMVDPLSGLRGFRDASGA